MDEALMTCHSCDSSAQHAKL